MIPHEPPDPEVIKEVFDRMLLRMRNYAIMSSGQVSPRTFVALQALDLADDLFEQKPLPIGHDIPLDIIKYPGHALRSSTIPGPLFVYRKAMDSKLTMIEWPVLLLSESQEIRHAAFGEMERMITDKSLDLTPKSAIIIRDQRDQFLSDDEHEWRKAAIAINDALHYDFALALQGARQSLAFEPAIQESLNAFMPRVLYPEISSVDSIVVDVGNPSSGHERLSTLVLTIAADSDTLEEACGLYMAKLGYVPIAESFSLGRVVERWISSHPECNAWDAVWKWAEQAFGPLPCYHACTVFVLHPEWIPIGKHAELWKKLLDVVNLGRTNTTGESDARWSMRNQLVRHYLMLFESQFAGQNCEAITCLAWLLAEKVMGLFPDKSDSARFYQKNWMEGCSNVSSSVWISSIARTEHSFVRCMTLSVNAPWAVSLLSLLGHSFSALHFPELDENMRKQFRDAIHRNLLMSFPFAGNKDTQSTTYAPEIGFGQTVTNWLEVSGDPESNEFRQLLELQQRLLSPDGMRTALETLDARQAADQVAVGMAMKVDAYRDAALAETVWTFLSNTDWRNRAFQGMAPTMIALYIEALLAYQAAMQDQWFYELPHYFAHLCEQATDQEHQEILFIATLQFAMAADSFSAIQRLLRGKRKDIYIPLAEKRTEHIKSIWAYHPAWAQGRLRATLSALSS